MEKAQLDAVTQFINRLPPKVFNNLGQIETARVFIWFAHKSLGLKYCKFGELEACFHEAHLAIPQRLEYKLRIDKWIFNPEPDAFALERGEMARMNEKYASYLKSSLPSAEELIEQTQLKYPSFLSENEISDSHRMMRPYLMLRLVEVSARKLLATQMVSIWGNNWLKTSEKSDKLTSGQKQGLKNIFEGAQNTKVGKFNKIINNENDLFSYLSFGDLNQILKNISPALEGAGWDYKNLEQIKSHLAELNNFRDAIDHSRTLQKEDVETLEIYYKNWCKLITG